ncbi:hypothetical protein DWQ65_06880 [Treponema phagedenis]|uniref:Uncharacterized protein n=1 Tax=Treponema phagedenis TaxID=162 RepID=A0AAE6IT92_TREPH|nr:hypothetical protein FUT79_06235 [Treponema phagedenis]QEJ97833.1 hypothetical protein FUT82_07380 [Treponema phagedenis]QEK00748.1 hypothetical protein FUT84_05905 [Treponema phagedenis]QEK03399.1 hypothetical protein FUT83_05990 [Treponema phagedenis]QEK05755.1 hypothetical protein FUT80_02820 [Treponema phagedenis]
MPYGKFTRRYQFQTMFCLIVYCKQAKLVGEVTVNFQNFALAPCRALIYKKLGSPEFQGRPSRSFN